MFIFFMVLVIGPAIVGNQLTKGVGPISLSLGGKPMILQQPTTWNNNDTSGEQTGTGNASNNAATATGSAASGSSTDAAAADSGGDAAALAAAGQRRVRRAMFDYN